MHFEEQNPSSKKIKARSHCPTLADRGEPGRIVKEFECVHIFQAMLRTRPGLGQTVITVCPGDATVCDGTFQV